jgi:hypothetical protein
MYGGLCYGERNYFGGSPGSSSNAGNYTASSATPTVYQPSYASYASAPQTAIPTATTSAPTYSLGNSAGLLGSVAPNFMSSFNSTPNFMSSFNSTPNLMSSFTSAPNFPPANAGAPTTQPMARGGIADLGSYSDGGRMLQGPGDGMSDSIPGVIANKRPARLADGEFVVPADVVSHLGNGSTDAGAKQLYAMMNKVRQARTGTKKQGKQINPRKLMPA